MSAKSILFIGEPKNYGDMIGRILSKGYRVLYVKGYVENLRRLGREDIKLIIVNSTNGHLNVLKRSGITDLIRSGIPVILAETNGFEDILVETFQRQAAVTPSDANDGVDIGSLVGRLLDGARQQSNKRENLAFRQEDGIVSLELVSNRIIGGSYDRITRAIAFMEKHHSDMISLEQIAHAALLSSYYFSRLFKKHMGVTCSRYLSTLRVEKAKELLRETELSVTEICYEVGFNTLTHFERVFKGLEGSTPSAYRQLC